MRLNSCNVTIYCIFFFECPFWLNEICISIFLALDVQEEKTSLNERDVVEKSRRKIVVEHCNIIEKSFWRAHQTILE